MLIILQFLLVLKCRHALKSRNYWHDTIRVGFARVSDAFSREAKSAHDVLGNVKLSAERRRDSNITFDVIAIVEIVRIVTTAPDGPIYERLVTDYIKMQAQTYISVSFINYFEY